AKTPDLILLDIMMPVMDGLEMCRCIKTNTRLKDIPVIILTAKGQKEDFQKALKAGADDFVVKPFDFDHLLQKISGIFDVKRADKNPGGKRG
ncbi:MAG: PleD family two-component system response regulator, partial [Nitrospinota bacterium]